MDKVTFLIQSFRRKSLFVILAWILLLAIPIVSRTATVLSQPNEAYKQKVLRQVAQDWIQVGMGLYRRRSYEAAERSFLRAHEYQKYLIAAERGKLNKLLKEAHIAALERKYILEHIQKAYKSVNQNRLIETKAHLEKVRDNEFLTKAEQEKLNGLLEKTKKASTTAFERRRILEYLQMVNELIEQDQLTKAKVLLEKLTGNKLLTQEERGELNELLGKIHAAEVERNRILESIQKVDKSVSQNQLMDTKARLEKIRDNAFLTEEERNKLNAVLEKAEMVGVERKLILEYIQKAEESVNRNRLIEARAHLEKVLSNKFLTKEEGELITRALKKINEQLNGRKKEIAELCDRIVQFHSTGQFESTYESFANVTGNNLSAAPMRKTAEDYLEEMGALLATRVKLSELIEAKPDKELPEGTTAAIEDKLLGVWTEYVQKTKSPGITQGPKKEPAVSAPGPIVDKQDSAEAVDRKINILRSYTRAVVDEATDKVRIYLSRGEFDKAKKAVEEAEHIVNKNQPYLGKELLRQYHNELKQLAEKIAQR